MRPVLSSHFLANGLHEISRLYSLLSELAGDGGGGVKHGGKGTRLETRSYSFRQGCRRELPGMYRERERCPLKVSRYVRCKLTGVARAERDGCRFREPRTGVHDAAIDIVPPLQFYHKIFLVVTTLLRCTCTVSEGVPGPLVITR